jgi:PAS domain S-box-containing protein
MNLFWAETRMTGRDHTGAETSLLSLPPTHRQTRWAIAVGVCQVAALSLLAPFAKTQLAEIDAFIPAFAGVIFVTNLVTSVLLFSQFAICRLRALLVLACGYLFSALMIIPYTLTFPGAFSPTGLLGAGLQTTASLYWFWHFLFPFALLGYGLMRDEKSDPDPGHPSSLALILRSVRSFQTGASFQHVNRLLRADGEYRWHNSRAEPLRDHKGDIIQWYGFNVDIDEGKKADDALRRNEDRLRRSEAYLAEAQILSHTGSWAHDPVTEKILYWSEGCYRLYGFDSAHGLPDPLVAYRRIHPDDQDRVWEEAMEARRQKRDYTTEFRIVLPDGTVKYVEGIIHHVLSKEGELIELVGTKADVTERRRAEQALRESEAKFRAAIDGIAGLVAIMAPSGELEAVNRPIIEYFGRTLEELKNWGTSDAVHPEDLPRVLESYKTSLAIGTPFLQEQRLRRFDGEYRWFENRGAPIRDESGRITRWYCLLVDIEDRMRALERLQQLQSDFAHMNRVSVMGELSASLAHEITQPIAAGRNYARAALNFLDRQPPDLDEVKKQLGSVVGAADRSGEIIERIREQIKKVPPRKARFDLNHAIDEMITLARSAITWNGVSVQTLLAEGLASVQGDRVQLQQVVLNLILNAVEAMGSVEPGTRELLISTEQDHNGILVAVCDSGPGIDPAHFERVFDAFYTTKPKGTGMGLSICRSIINAHGGRLWVGVNEPRGAVFQFILPDANGNHG